MLNMSGHTLGVANTYCLFGHVCPRSDMAEPANKNTETPAHSPHNTPTETIPPITSKHAASAHIPTPKKHPLKTDYRTQPLVVTTVTTLMPLLPTCISPPLSPQPTLMQKANVMMTMAQNKNQHMTFY